MKQIHFWKSCRAHVLLAQLGRHHSDYQPPVETFFSEFILIFPLWDFVGNVVNFEYFKKTSIVDK